MGWPTQLMALKGLGWASPMLSYFLARPSPIQPSNFRPLWAGLSWVALAHFDTSTLEKTGSISGFVLREILSTLRAV